MVEVPFKNVVAEVQGMTTEDEDVVQVKVVGPKNAPDSVKEARARMRALASTLPSGALASVIGDAATDFDLHRLTELQDEPVVREEEGFISDLIPSRIKREFDIGELEARLYTVRVLGDED